MSKLIRVSEIAKRWEVTPAHVRHLLNDGSLRGVRVGLRAWRVSEEEVARFINEQRNERRAK